MGGRGRCGDAVEVQVQAWSAVAPELGGIRGNEARLQRKALDGAARGVLEHRARGGLEAARQAGKEMTREKCKLLKVCLPFFSERNQTSADETIILAYPRRCHHPFSLSLSLSLFPPTLTWD